MKREEEPPFYVAVRFARLRDRSIGQTDEIQALLNIVDGTERIMKMTNEALVRKFKNQKPRSPEYIQQTTFDIVVSVQDNLAKFIDAKTARITKILDYFRLDERDVSEDIQKLKEFEILWDDLKQKYDHVKNEFLCKPSSTYSTSTLNELQVFQDLISSKGIPLMKRLKDLEDKIQKDILYQIASFTKANTVVDSNELYKLLTGEP